MATKDGRTQIWYADGNGNVEGYTETVGDIAETIISTYNEHFGTDIQLWTPETKTLQVGGTIPDWNAYEKIETTIFIKALFAGNKYTFGYLTIDKIFHWQMLQQNSAKYASIEGIVENNAIAPADSYWQQVLLPQLQQKWNVESYEEVEDSSLSPGTAVPNWQIYEIAE